MIDYVGTKLWAVTDHQIVIPLEIDSVKSCDEDEDLYYWVTTKCLSTDGHAVTHHNAYFKEWVTELPFDKFGAFTDELEAIKYALKMSENKERDLKEKMRYIRQCKVNNLARMRELKGE